MWEQYDNEIFFINNGDSYLTASILNNDIDVLSVLNDNFEIKNLDDDLDDIMEFLSNDDILIIEKLDIINYDDEDYLEQSPYLRDSEIMEKFKSEL